MASGKSERWDTDTMREASTLRVRSGMTSQLRNMIRIAALPLAAAALGAAQPPAALPDATGRDVVQRVCGACHPATIVAGRGMTAQGWDEVVASMISRGAKGSPSDFKSVTDYLARNFPPNPGSSRTRTAHPHAGPSDQPVVDPESAARGGAVYTADCASCHGKMARGGSGGPDLVRSEVVLHDRYGNVLAPYLRGKHPDASSPPFTTLTKANVEDLSEFLREQVNNTLRSGPFTKVIDVLTGDPQAGKAYFDGPGGCAACHSATGDLAGIASRYAPPALQQRLLFPRTVALGGGALSTVKPETIQVTLENGQSFSGTPVYVDEFNVSLRDSAGTYHSWKRTPETKVELHDPYQAHDDLLDRITDPDIHNLVAYLETLK
jgi:cytochrome c oxidase cbb3-type subunit 3